MAQSFRTVVIDARKNQKLSLAENQDSESMRKLRSLREKILKEYEAEKSERETIDQREPIIPISLASDFIQKQKSSSGSYDAQQEVREKVKYLKLDRVLQNELEAGLEVKANEMNGLKYQNKRLRDIIILRESCNTRKEKTFEQEISFLKNLIDDVCIESMEHDTMMQRLRALNEQIQDEFELLKTTIEEKAETERLALIRTYRVRMRDVKQQLSIQEEKNLAGAKAWITRYEMLDRDRAEAEKDCENLKMQNASISDSNNEIRVMHQHQDRQRESLTYKIVMLKRENKRLENHIQTLSEKLPVMNRHTLTYNPLKHDETFNRKDLQKNALGEIEDRQADELVKTRKTLEAVRKSLKQIQGAHIGLLQERTELEVFLRQCVDDVRRDMYSITAANNNLSESSKDSPPFVEAKLIHKHVFKDKKELIDILYSKLEVIYLLHQRMFPHKALDQKVGGYILQTDEPVESKQHTIISNVDNLWQRWKDWSNSPSSLR